MPWQERHPVYVDSQYPLSALTSRIIAAAQEVHRVLGPGFREIIYQRALAKEFPGKNLSFRQEESIDVEYKGQRVGRMRVDFIVGDSTDDVMVEIKAKAQLEAVDYVKALSHLKALGYVVGLLINFGNRHLEVKRLVND